MADTDGREGGHNRVFLALMIFIRVREAYNRPTGLLLS